MASARVACLPCSPVRPARLLACIYLRPCAPPRPSQPPAVTHHQQRVRRSPPCCSAVPPTYHRPVVPVTFLFARPSPRADDSSRHHQPLASLLGVSPNCLPATSHCISVPAILCSCVGSAVQASARLRKCIGRSHSQPCRQDHEPQGPACCAFAWPSWGRARPVPAQPGTPSGIHAFHCREPATRAPWPWSITILHSSDEAEGVLDAQENRGGPWPKLQCSLHTSDHTGQLFARLLCFDIHRSGSLVDSIH